MFLALIPRHELALLQMEQVRHEIYGDNHRSGQITDNTNITTL